MANFNNRLTMDFAFLLVSYNGILLNFWKLKIHVAKVGTREAKGVIPTGTVMLIIPYTVGGGKMRERVLIKLGQVHDVVTLNCNKY